MTTSDRRRGARTAGAGRFPVVVAIVAGAFLAVAGVWAMVAPRSFFDAVATFEPYNEHLIQDIGAFQIGLGAVLLLAAAARTDALVTGLVGVGVGAAAHVVSHVVGHDLGGSPTLDIPFFSIFAVVLLGAGAYRWRHRNDS